MPTSRALGKDIRIIVLPYPMPLAIFSSVGRVHGVARLVTPSHPPWRCAQPQKALRAESNGIKTTGGKPKDILIWNSSVKWINIDREFQHVAHNSEIQISESPGWVIRQNEDGCVARGGGAHGKRGRGQCRTCCQHPQSAPALSRACRPALSVPPLGRLAVR